MSELLVGIDLYNCTPFLQDWGGLIGLRVVARFPERFERLVISNTGLPTVCWCMAVAADALGIAEHHTFLAHVHTGRRAGLEGVPRVGGDDLADGPILDHDAAGRQRPVRLPAVSTTKNRAAHRLAIARSLSLLLIEGQR